MREPSAGVEPGSPTAGHRPTRRAVLLGAGAVGAVGVLAACGDSPTTPPPGGASVTAAPSGSPSPSTSQKPASGPQSEGIPVSQVPVGGGVIDTGRRVVVTQPEAGEFRAFDAICQHEFCLVSQIGDGLITCTCHGSQYHITDGSVARGPTTRGLPMRTATVDGDVIVVS